MKINTKNIKKAAIKYADEYSGDTTMNNRSALIRAFIAGAKSVSSNAAPTHCKFLKEKDAADWGCTTKEWLGIESIQHDDVSTIDFAWVPISQLEFKTDKVDMCAKCRKIPVMRKGDKCEECLEEDEVEDHPNNIDELSRSY